MPTCWLAESLELTPAARSLMLKIGPCLLERRTIIGRELVMYEATKSRSSAIAPHLPDPLAILSGDLRLGGSIRLRDPVQACVRGTRHLFKGPTRVVRLGGIEYRRSLSRQEGGTALMDETGDGGGFSARSERPHLLDRRALVTGRSYGASSTPRSSRTPHRGG